MRLTHFMLLVLSVLLVVLFPQIILILPQLMYN